MPEIPLYIYGSNNSEVQIWFPLPLPLTDFVVPDNRIYQAHLIVNCLLMVVVAVIQIKCEPLYWASFTYSKRIRFTQNYIE
jgi:hypothetical protein